MQNFMRRGSYVLGTITYVPGLHSGITVDTARACVHCTSAMSPLRHIIKTSREQRSEHHFISCAHVNANMQL